MKKKGMQVLVVALGVLLLALPSLALEPTGELNASVGLQWNGEEQKLERTTTQTGFRFVLEDALDFGGRLHVSTKGWWDWRQKSGQLELDQLWLSGYQGDVDYQLGRQVISWGTADGFNPTNYFARMSLDSLFSGDMTGDPLWAAQATYYGDNWSATGVVVPWFIPQELDETMQQMMIGQNPQATLMIDAIQNTKKPRGLGKNSEWALRAETQLAGFDVQASLFSGFEPLPGLEMVMTANPEFGLIVPSMEGTYRRQTFAGLAATGTIGPVGVWAELSYGGPAKFGEPENPLEIARIPLSINEKYLQAVVGADYTFAMGKGLLVQGQYIYRGQGSLMAPYVMPDLERMQPGAINGAHYLYGRVGYDFSPSSSADVVVLHGFEEGGGLIRPSYTHRFPGSVQLQVSLLRLYGEDELFSSMGMAGQIAVTYQF